MMIGLKLPFISEYISMHSCVAMYERAPMVEEKMHFCVYEEYDV